MSSTLTALAIFFGALLVMGIVAYFVPIITQPERGTASNYLFHISLPKNLTYRAAVLAQERWEQQWRLRRLGIFALFGQREMQLQSHAVECAAAGVIYGQDARVYAVKESERMFSAASRSYEELEGMSVEEIYEELVRRLPGATGWVLANRKLLEAYR